MNKEDFYTVAKANAGIRMPLTKLDGTDSGQWLLVRGTDSDAFRRSRFEAAEKVSSVDEGATEWDRAQVMDAAILENLVSLVAGWSFKEPCTPEAIREFLTNAPQVAADIDRVAADRAHFYGKPEKPAKPATTKAKR